ncbi:hypothetical protein [Chondromyces crocatus]|uniref:Lipoprotein n=1 Tax=Chondromyces crocatus TaxID=52 RepID=A0A0K1EDP1_CHOCO|nr:hypothetical protein [Chondromyces crocatus]AKT38991.1 uncharacterized protein CMC5_031370 [Chondromyces crocatus]
MTKHKAFTHRLGALFCGLTACIGTGPQETYELEPSGVMDASSSHEQAAMSDEDESDPATERGGGSTDSVLYCSGFSGPGSMCHTQCSDDVWYAVGTHPTTPIGACTTIGNWYCVANGMHAIAHCWN